MHLTLVKVNFSYSAHLLDFKFEAGTSRGILKQKKTYYIKAVSTENPYVAGWGEAGPLPKLSVDDVSDMEEVLAGYCKTLSGVDVPLEQKDFDDWVRVNIAAKYPSIRFAFETALLDLANGGIKKIVDNDFYNLQKPIPINGLVWMGSKSFMLDQIDQKIKAGYSCIKLKIGAIDFDQECDLLEYIRSNHSQKEITLRVDANGAFPPEEALARLKRLAYYGLHSIEQPIGPGQQHEMAKLCESSPIPIALDEELIGIDRLEDKKELLELIKPQYLILKPTLIGGLASGREWITQAESMGIGWWMTSALESNIGLNAIAQFTAGYDPDIPQGLGTGQLYRNNIGSPLVVSRGKIYYDDQLPWEI